MTSTTGTALHQTADSLSMSDSVFQDIVDIASREAGLMITDSKRALVQSRISRRIRALGDGSPEEYISRIKTGSDPNELSNMISALTTNVSSFFRESHHFDELKKSILPGLVERARTGEKIRIWSAGCSSGQEPYTIAMLVLEAAPDVHELDFKILASDIDHNILSKAKKAQYDSDQLSAVPKPLRARFFDNVEDQSFFVAKFEIRNIVNIRKLNLLDEWPMRETYQVVFCRNVVIYFDDETQRNLWPKFKSLIEPGGRLYLGHSERIPDPGDFGFSPAGVTTYLRQ